MSILKRIFGCCCNCCCKCNCKSCCHKIEKGDMVRYNDEAKKSISTVIPEGNPFRRVTEVKERYDGTILVYRGNNASDSMWLEKCCC